VQGQHVGQALTAIMMLKPATPDVQLTADSDTVKTSITVKFYGMSKLFVGSLLFHIILIEVCAIPVEYISMVGADSTIYNERGGHTWALLVAGSKGYGNYRHQADVCHAYQVLRNRGLDENRIITMFYDDVAHSFFNPYKSKLFNEVREYPMSC
jgi:hypothetical protein